METLDRAYLNKLVSRASGDSDAFAELFAATVKKMYGYVYFMVSDDAAAFEITKQTYCDALLELAFLRKPDLFLPWLTRKAFLLCGGSAKDGDEKSGFNYSQIMNLPVTESQAMLMIFVQGLSAEETCNVLNLSRSSLKRCLNTAFRHLDVKMPVRVKRSGTSRVNSALSAARTVQMLEDVFDECGARKNATPLEALSSYAVYRSERFSLQRAVTAAGLVIFLLLPVLFILPKYSVNADGTGERGLPVYRVEVESFFPADKVSAKINGHALPVYENSAKSFTIEPTRNGSLSVSVELFNRQAISSTVDVDDVDSKGPVLTDSVTGDDYFLLKVEDDGIGVDYREIYAVSGTGEFYYPASVDEQTGEVVFEYPDENWDVYIPDHIGNTLHLAVTLS